MDKQAGIYEWEHLDADPRPDSDSETCTSGLKVYFHIYQYKYR